LNLRYCLVFGISLIFLRGTAAILIPRFDKPCVEIVILMEDEAAAESSVVSLDSERHF